MACGKLAENMKKIVSYPKDNNYLANRTRTKKIGRSIDRLTNAWKYN